MQTDASILLLSQFCQTVALAARSPTPLAPLQRGQPVTSIVEAPKSHTTVGPICPSDSDGVFPGLKCSVTVGYIWQARYYGSGTPTASDTGSWVPSKGSPLKDFGL